MDSSRQNSPRRFCFTIVGDFIADYYQQISQNFITLPGRAIIFMEYISLRTYTLRNAKNCVFIAVILSELHAPWQLVMQGHVIGLTTLKVTYTHFIRLSSYKWKESISMINQRCLKYRYRYFKHLYLYL